MAVIIDIADAVVTELNGATLSLPLTAERHYRPIFDLKDMKTLHVTVVPKGVEVTPAGRSNNHYDYQIDVAVQKKLADGSGASGSSQQRVSLPPSMRTWVHRSWLEKKGLSVFRQNEPARTGATPSSSKRHRTVCPSAQASKKTFLPALSRR